MARAGTLGLWMALLYVPAGCDLNDGGEGLPVDPQPSDVATAEEEQHPVRVNQPSSLEALDVPVPGLPGRTAAVRCSSCHDKRSAPFELPERAEDVEGPHEGLVFEHGDLPCAACHDRERADQLHLASGELFPLQDAIRLCSQCHGPQGRDYRHGAHGGMRGHWDLATGPRERNHCVDCHNPHEPAFPKLQPMPGPRDRFSGASEADHD